MKRDRLPHGSKNDFCMILAKHGAYEKVPIWSLNGCSGPIGAGRSGGVSRLSQKKYPVDTSGHGEAQKNIKTRQNFKNITTPYRQGKPCAFLHRAQSHKPVHQAVGYLRGSRGKRPCSQFRSHDG